MTDRHILLCVNNCGSSHGWVLLRDTCGGRLVTKGKSRHAPIRVAKPEWLKGRAVIGMLRNPFGWYVGGWYKQHCLQRQRGVHAVGFEEWFWDLNRQPWRHLTVAYWPPEPRHIRPGACTFFHLHFHLPQALKVFDEYRSMAEVERDYDSLLRVDDWVRCHTYYEDFARILGRPLVIDKSLYRNQHAHGPHQDYYTPEMRRYVQENDAFLLERYGYTWDGPAYRSAEHKYPPMPSAIAVEKGSE